MFNSGPRARGDPMRYRRPSIFWCVAKWVGFVASVLILIVWLVSLRVGIAWNRPTKPGWSYVFAVHDGNFGAYGGWLTASSNSRFMITLNAKPQTFGLNLPAWNRKYSVFSLPLWIPLLIVGLSTARLWAIGRRIPRDHCQKCRYNLTGNESGKCPECFTPVPKREATA